MKFDKALLTTGEYLMYGAERRFVARFKHNRHNRVSFIKFLVNNFTVEEYFAAYAAGDAPFTILRNKGWMPTVR